MSEKVEIPDPDDLGVPSVDVCAICGDPYCDGISCVSDIDPNDLDDHSRLEQLQSWVRAGRAWEKADLVLAIAENRSHEWRPR